MTAAIYYHPEAYSIDGPKLMGRNAAGASFLRGFLAHSKTTKFWIQTESADHTQHFARAVAASGRKEPVKVANKTNLGALKEAGVVYYPGPGIGPEAFHRTAFGDGAWSLCGVTHTTSSALAMDSITALITSPVQSWDALICTSTTVKDNVHRLMQGQVDYLKERLGASKLVLPQLPVIPLGVHTRDFSFSDAQKAAARRALGVDADTLVVLYMGRLSFHAKAHPLAMYQALEAAAAQTGKSVLLVECGWHANTFIEKAYADAARLACPHVRTLNLDGRKAAERETVWAGADIFCSLSDNIQETFGITPIEAMAAGLPVVVSDWDGYRDTVRDGIDGWRIPTLMPQAGLAGDLAFRHALEIDTYDQFCGLTCSLIAVDVEATTKAFVNLFTSPDLRRQMGQAGRSRARQVYDWASIIPQYEALWAQLTEMRVAGVKTLKPVAHPWPARMDPFHSFASYPTHKLTPRTILALVDGDAKTAMQRAATFRQLAMIQFAQVVMPSDAEVEMILTQAARGPQTALELIAVAPAARRPFVLRSLAWLAKLGVLRTEGEGAPATGA